MSDELIVEVAHVSATENDLQGLTRPLLELMQRVTGLESTYLTHIEWEKDFQKILYSRNTGEMDVPEDFDVPWEDTVCRVALETGIANTNEVPEVFPDSQAAKLLGIQTYISVPIRTKDDAIFGTLCGASKSRLEIEEEAMEVMRLFARLIADQVDREQAATHHRLRAEQAEARLRSRARFLAEANHMLKTPLTVIKGWAATLARKAHVMDPQQVQDALNTIETRAEELAMQIDDLLDEARTEILVSELELTHVEIGKSLRHAASSFGARESHPVSVVVTGSPIAIADGRSLDQVLGHLIDNAIKYSPDGGGIELRGIEDGPIVVIEVVDNGIGLPLGFDPFEPFQRGAEETSRGVGLGLHIVKNLVEAMNGTVSGDRNSKKGSTFTVRLPSA